MTQRNKWFLCILGVVAIVWAAVAYFQWRYFPGELFYASGCYYRRDSDRETALGSDFTEAGEDYLMSHRHFVMSPLCDRAAFLDEDDHGKAEGLVIREFSDSKPAAGRYQRFDLSKYKLPQCMSSNLEWSPDGRRVAYAAQDTLYVADCQTGKVTSAALPPDPGSALVMKARRDYRRSILVKQTGTRGSDALRNELKAGPGADSVTKAAAKYLDFSEVGVALAEMVDNRPVPQPLRKALTDVQRRTIEAFGLSRATRLSFLDSLGGFSSFAGLCNGRRLRWTDKGTIYCDNWKLAITRDEPGKIEYEAARTAFPCEFFARPVISPKGDVAAYLVSAHPPGRPKNMPGSYLVFVDSKGKVLKRLYIASAMARQALRWSRDGRYVVYVEMARVRRDFRGYKFHILEWRTSRDWWVFLSDREYFDGWDWVGPARD